MSDFEYTDLLPVGADETPYRLLTTEGVSVVEAAGRSFLQVEPEALRLLTFEAMRDIAHLLRPGHLQQLANILDDPEASPNDRFVALDLLKNANIAAGGILPMCQDTGTAIVMGKRGQHVLTPGLDEEAISRGVYEAYNALNLRYSQMAPLTMWDEKNTGSNLPAQIELYADTAPGHELAYKFLFMAKGGGSANKSYLFQETKAVLNPASMMRFLEEKIRGLGTAACPPYHLAIVVGGTSAEFALKTAKYASARYLDTLPKQGSPSGHAFRDLELEAEVLELTRTLGIGAQFGGKYFCHDVRVVRLPRHGASCPVAIAVSCSADRQALGKITPEGVFLEALEREPAHFLPETTDEHLSDDVVRIDLNPRRCPRHRSREDQGALGRRGGHARLPARPRGLLRRTGQDPRGLRIGILRTHHGRTHGRLRRPIPEGRRLDGDAGQGQPIRCRHPGLRRQWWLLPRIHRRARRSSGPGLHQEGRSARLRRTRHGSGVAHRGRRLPRLHRGRRQGQRLLQGPLTRPGHHERPGSSRRLGRPRSTLGPWAMSSCTASRPRWRSRTSPSRAGRSICG
jgi:tartrate/fumarate subfamily iron-sulfur-dependent hydro-lyase alpha chain